MSDYLTKTKLMTYRQCPLLYKYRNIDKIREPSNEYFERGIMLHEFFDKYNKGETQEAAKVMEKIKADGHQEHAESFLSFDQKIRQDGTEIIFSEKSITIDEENLKGIIDVVYRVGDKIVVLDYKTGKFHDDKVADYRVELGFYYHLLEVKEKIRPTHWGMFFSGNKYLFIEPVTDVMLNRTQKSINNAKEGIASGNFPKKFSRLCDYCQFKKECWG